MQKHRSDWDVTTAEGRIALERCLMKRIGYIDEDLKKPWEGWFIVQTLDEYREYLPDHVEPGWVFTPEGMVALKQWAAEEYGWEIESLVGNSFARAVVLHADPAYPRQIGKADDEPTAVALALARALEEMER